MSAFGIEQVKKEENPEEDSATANFTPVVQLKEEIAVTTHEEDEDVLFKMRAKLFRFEGGQWKERGTGEVKFLRHKESQKIRLLMRREKTLKVCANHYILPNMELKENIGSDRSWVWSTLADFADEVATHEKFAIRFANTENAQKFKDKFDECKNPETAKTVVPIADQSKDETETEPAKEATTEKAE